jgi:hypothetical protein
MHKNWGFEVFSLVLSNNFLDKKEGSLGFAERSICILSAKNTSNVCIKQPLSLFPLL